MDQPARAPTGPRSPTSSGSAFVIEAGSEFVIGPTIVVVLGVEQKNRILGHEAVDLVLAQLRVAHGRAIGKARILGENLALVDDDAAVDLARVVVAGDRLDEFVGRAELPGRGESAAAVAP